MHKKEERTEDKLKRKRRSSHVVKGVTDEKAKTVWAYEESRYRTPTQLPELQVRSKTTEKR
jgi:hypothetical protein